MCFTRIVKLGCMVQCSIINSSSSSCLHVAQGKQQLRYMQPRCCSCCVQCSSWLMAPSHSCEPSAVCHQGHTVPTHCANNAVLEQTLARCAANLFRCLQLHTVLHTVPAASKAGPAFACCGPSSGWAQVQSTTIKHHTSARMLPLPNPSFNTHNLIHTHKLYTPPTRPNTPPTHPITCSFCQPTHPSTHP